MRATVPGVSQGGLASSDFTLTIKNGQTDPVELNSSHTAERDALGGNRFYPFEIVEILTRHVDEGSRFQTS